MALYGLFFNVTYPADLGQWALLLAVLPLSWLCSFSFRFLLNLSAFWSPNARGVIRLGFVAAWFFSGFLMPLRFFPDWVQRAAMWTPFPHMMHTVAEVYLGTLSGAELLQALALQLGWAAGLTGLCLWLLRRGMNHLVIQGG